MSGQVVPIREGTVAVEVANQEFDRFLDAMDLRFDLKGLDDEDRKSFEEAKRLIVRAIVGGQLVVDERGQCIFTPKLGDTSPITFYEPTGASLIAMDQKKVNHTVEKAMATLADMTKQPPVRFSNMANRDLKVCMAIEALFLG